MSMFTVDDTCVRCGMCADLCLRSIIELKKPDKPFVAAEREAECMQCGQCVVFCPKSACHLDFQPAEDSAAVDQALLPSKESAIAFLRANRSIRRFQDKEVEEAVVRDILETCRYASTAANTQLVRWVVAGKRKTHELAGLVVDGQRETIKKAKNPESIRKQQAVIDAWDAGVDKVFHNAPNLAIALIDKKYHFPEDASIALTYFSLAALAHKVGCCWSGFIMLSARGSEPLRAAIGAGERETVAGALMFGYPKGGLVARALPPRKKVDVTFM